MATAQVGVGDAAPEFELLAGGFQQVKLSDYKGKKVVLAFFPCCFSGAVDDGCQCQMEALTALTDAGVAVFGISRDQPFGHGPAGWPAPHSGHAGHGAMPPTRIADAEMSAK